MTFDFEDHLPPIIFTRDAGWAEIKRGRGRGELLKVRHGASAPVVEFATPWERERHNALTMIRAVANTLTVPYAFSHASAVTVHELGDIPWDGRSHVSQRNRQGRWRTPGLHHHWAPWQEEDVTWINGLPVTSIARTMIDCSVSLRADWALAVFDSGLRRLADMSRFQRAESEERQRVIRAELATLLKPRKGDKGIVQAREINACGDGFAEGFPESRMRWVPLAQGIPPPICQLQIETSLGFRYPDFAWRMCDLTGNPRDPRVIAEEYDGVEKYGPTDAGRPAAAINVQAQRDEALRLADVLVRHRFARDLESPAALFRSMASRLPTAVVAAAQPRPGLMIPRR